jgi:hypothetical protein
VIAPTEPSDQRQKQAGPRRPRRGAIAIIVAFILALVAFLANSAEIFAFLENHRHRGPYQLWSTQVVSNSLGRVPTGHELPAKYLHKKDMTIEWRGGSVVLSGRRDEQAQLWVDDILSVDFTDSQGTEIKPPIVLDFSDDCRVIDKDRGPINLSNHLKRGENFLHFRIEDNPDCAGPRDKTGWVGSSDIFLVGNFKPAD